ncbi:MAG: hypothetical protein G8237_08155 [Magnetococcales bacterium]|nr:hypothetical protein [Magnetococcales bacterium]
MIGGDERFNHPEVAELVNQAESLAWSDDWRKTAKEMRQLRERWEQLERECQEWDREWTTRFRAAQQTFMDRRADYFSQGNVRKGAGLIEQLDGKQEQIIQLKQEIRGYYQSLREFEERLQTTGSEGHGLAIRAFIGDSIVALQEEIQRKERALQKMERTMLEVTGRYYCVE